jgi:hypothetical protein
MESSEYITVPVALTATSLDNSELHTTLSQASSTGFVLEIQIDTQSLDTDTGVLNLFRVFFILVLTEFELVDTVLKDTVLLDITLFKVPVLLTAAKTFNSAAQQTAAQSLSTAVFRRVHAVPSGLVILLFPVPVLLTAMKRASPEAQTTELQL